MGTIKDDLDGLDAGDREAVERVYAVAREMVPDVEQGTGYGMPALTYRGTSLVSVMRAKGHIGVHPFSPAAVEAAAQQRAGYDNTWGTIRFQPDHPLPDAAIRALIARRRDQIDG